MERRYGKGSDNDLVKRFRGEIAWRLWRRVHHTHDHEKVESHERRRRLRRSRSMRETCSGLTLAFYRTVEHVLLATNDHEKERAGKYAIRRGWRRTTICRAMYRELSRTRLDATSMRSKSFDIARGFLSRYPLPPSLPPTLPPLKFILRMFRSNVDASDKNKYRVSLHREG